MQHCKQHCKQQVVLSKPVFENESDGADVEAEGEVDAEVEADVEADAEVEAEVESEVESEVEAEVDGIEDDDNTEKKKTHLILYYRETIRPIKEATTYKCLNVLTKPKDDQKDKKVKIEKTSKNPRKICPDCEKGISIKSERCASCASKHCNVVNRKVVDRPSKEELEQMVKATSFSAVARQFGVSDHAVRKWLGLRK